MSGCIYRTKEGKCKQFSVGGVLSFCYLGGTCDCQIPSNADRIRAMSDEELAETYAGGCPNGDRLNCGKYYLHGGRDCFNCWLDWLKSPVEVET